MPSQIGRWTAVGGGSSSTDVYIKVDPRYTDAGAWDEGDNPNLICPLDVGMGPTYAPNLRSREEQKRHWRVRKRWNKEQERKFLTNPDLQASWCRENGIDPDVVASFMFSTGEEVEGRRLCYMLGLVCAVCERLRAVAEGPCCNTQAHWKVLSFVGPDGRPYHRKLQTRPLSDVDFAASLDNTVAR